MWLLMLARTLPIARCNAKKHKPCGYCIDIPMSEVFNKFSRMPRKLSRRTLRLREERAMEYIGGPHMLSEVNPQGLVARFLAGETIRKMAKQYGVSRIAMYQFLLRNVPEEWVEAQRARAYAVKEDGEDRIEKAKNPLQLQKGKEQASGGRWDLERLWRKVYGRDNPEINININDLGDRLRRARERVINVNAQVIEETQDRATSPNTRAQEEQKAA